MYNLSITAKWNASKVKTSSFMKFLGQKRKKICVKERDMTNIRLVLNGISRFLQIGCNEWFVWILIKILCTRYTYSEHFHNHKFRRISRDLFFLWHCHQRMEVFCIICNVQHEMLMKREQNGDELMMQNRDKQTYPIFNWGRHGYTATRCRSKTASIRPST